MSEIDRDLHIKPGRRKHVAKLVRRVGILDADISADALLLYVIGALIANDDGHMPQERLHRAAMAPHLQEAAAGILAAVRHARGRR